ncbi:MAG: glutamate--tRNA ligase [Alphaproteobacteria bacterium]|nr:glutamate--tRNA ligase [Alphaproteobacteria bacterium]
MSVVTRFAPSPTGFLHIGGARTALFNYLFARRHGGRYLLRIEDTDLERSTPEAVAAIHDGLNWLGLDGDGDAVSQSARAPRHIDVAEELLKAGHAYRCYLTPEELAAMREEARSTGQKITSPWRDADPATAPDRPYTVRLKMPLDGETTISDGVQGDVTVAHSTLDDLVMLRGDGSPTYMLAVVVDDHDMGITHVIRGDDHLNNAFRQIKIIEAMGWETPHYAHIPLIHGADGAKLSKRHGALSATAYRDMGFLPDAMCNYLLKLGWSHGDDEIISRDDAISWFGFDGIGKAPARFDTDKLTSLNAHYIRSMTPEALAGLILEGKDAPAHIIERLTMLAPAFAERAQLLGDLPKIGGFATHDDVPALDDDAKPLLDDDACARLHQFAADLPDGDMTPEELKTWLGGWLDQNNLKMRDIGPCLRAAVTGMKQTPDIVMIAASLGPAVLRKRIEGNCKK